MVEDKCPVFLCYRRQDGEWCAEWLYALLNGQTLHVVDGVDAKIDLFFDKMLPPVDNWRAHHLPAMQRARAFILVTTPGVRSDLSKPGQPDWVHEEINWWVNNRGEAPIIVDTTGDGNRWLPDVVLTRWPDANRVEITQDQITHAKEHSQDSFPRTVRHRLLAGVTLSGKTVAFEDLARLQRLTHRLRRWLVVSVVGIVLAAGTAAFTVYLSAALTDRSNRLANQLELSARLVGEGLAYRGLASMEGDPALAFRFGFEASRFDPWSSLPYKVMRRALLQTPVWRRFIPPETWEEQLFFLPPGATPYDSLAISPNFEFLLTGASTRENSGEKPGKTLYLYDIEDGTLLDERKLRDDERVLTTEDTIGRFYAIERGEKADVEATTLFYLLNPQDWKTPAFEDSCVKAHVFDTTTDQCFVLRNDGAIIRYSLLQGDEPAVQEDTIASWTEAALLSIHPSAPALLLWSDQEVRRVDTDTGVLSTVYKSPDSRRVVRTMAGPSRGEVVVVTISGDFMQRRLHLDAIDSSGTHPLVSHGFPSFQFMDDNTAGILSASIGAERIVLAYSAEEDAESGIKVIDLEWESQTGSAFAYIDRGPLDTGREAATFDVGGNIAISPDGGYLYHASQRAGTSGTTSTGGAMVTWDLASLDENSTLRPVPVPIAGLHTPVIRVAFDLDGARVLIWDARGISHIYKRRSGTPPLFQQRTRLAEEHEKRFFKPDVTQWDMGRLALVCYSPSDKRYIDLSTGLEIQLDRIVGEQPILDSSWIAAPEETFTVVTKRSVIAVREGLVVREMTSDDPPARAFVNEHGVALGFNDKITVLDVSTLDEIAQIEVKTAPVSLWLDSKGPDSGIKLYALLNDGSYHLWDLSRSLTPSVATHPEVTLDGPGNAYSYRVSNTDMLISHYEVEKTSFGFGLAAKQPPTEIRRFDLKTGEQLSSLPPPEGGWPDRALRIERMAVTETGEWCIVFATVGTRNVFVGIWTDREHKPNTWLNLGDVEVEMLRPENPHGEKFAVVSLDDLVRIVSLQDGTIIGEIDRPLGGGGLVPRIAIDSGKPMFVTDHHFRQASARLARGGLDTAKTITNVTLDERTKSELDGLFEVLVDPPN